MKIPIFLSIAIIIGILALICTSFLAGIQYGRYQILKLPSAKIDLSIDKNKKDFYELIQKFKDKRLVENLGR